MNLFDINEALAAARKDVQRIENRAVQIGRLATDDAILRKMTAGQLNELKRKLKSWNMHTYTWRD